MGMNGVPYPGRDIIINQSTGTIALNASQGIVPTIGAFESRQSGYPHPGANDTTGLKSRFQTMNHSLHASVNADDSQGGPQFIGSALVSGFPDQTLNGIESIKVREQSLVVEDNHIVSPMHADTKATVTIPSRNDQHDTLKMKTLESSNIKVEPCMKNFNPTATEPTIIQEHADTEEIKN